MSHPRSKTVLYLGALSAAIACSSGRPPNDGGVSITQAYSPTVKACALGVADTQIEIADTLEGADVIFRTSSEHVFELRNRVFDQAAMHGPEAHAGAGHSGVHGAAQAHGLRLWDLPALRAQEVDIQGGARLQVFASDPAHVDELRARLRDRVAKLDAKDCP